MGHYIERKEVNSTITSHLLLVKKGDFLTGYVPNDGLKGTKSKIIVKVLEIIEEKETEIEYSVQINRNYSLKLEVVRCSIDNTYQRIGDVFHTGTGNSSILDSKWYVLGVEGDKIPNIMSPFERAICRFLKIFRKAEKEIPETTDDFYIIFKSFLDIIDLVYAKLDDGYGVMLDNDDEYHLIKKILKYNKKVKLYLTRLNTEIFHNHKNGHYEIYDMFRSFLIKECSYREEEFKLKMMIVYTITQQARGLVMMQKAAKNIKKYMKEMNQLYES